MPPPFPHGNSVTHARCSSIVTCPLPTLMSYVTVFFIHVPWVPKSVAASLPVHEHSRPQCRARARFFFFRFFSSELASSFFLFFVRARFFWSLVVACTHMHPSLHTHENYPPPPYTRMHHNPSLGHEPWAKKNRQPLYLAHTIAVSDRLSSVTER